MCVGDNGFVFVGAGVWADECLSGELTQCGLFARDEFVHSSAIMSNAFRSSKETLSLFDRAGPAAALWWEVVLADIVER